MSLANSKAKISGADTHSLTGSAGTDTHISNLTGTLVMAKILDSAQQKAIGTVPSSMETSRIQIGSLGNAKITISNVTTPTEDSVLVIIVGAGNALGGPGTLNKNWLLKRGTTTIDTFSLIASTSSSISVDMRLFTTATPTSGTHDYILEENDPNTFGTVTMQLFFIEGTDTHGASLGGSAGTDTHALGGDNTQDTNASKSLP